MNGISGLGVYEKIIMTARFRIKKTNSTKKNTVKG